MALKRAKTTKELEVEAQEASLSKREQLAYAGLQVLRGQMQALKEFSKMGKLINDINEHVSWLIAEDEAYARAAAKLFADEALHGRQEPGV